MEDRLAFLKSEVNIGNFARHRADELTILTKIIEYGMNDADGHSHGGSNKRVFQKLPRHMRRRAMSHNYKRVPRRLMELHKKELESFPKKASKRPSRRFRRRPKQLLQEYNRRQRTFIWLETHIWHAKRFKMISCWNYKIPLYPNDKSWRACYHGSQRAALLQDLSYLCCIELKGVRATILEKLKELTNTDCGLTIASAFAQSGCYESSCLFYRRNSYPYNCICPVTYFWRSTLLQNESCLWLWCHPSSFDELLAQLIECFDVKQISSETDQSSNEEKVDLLKNSNFQKLAPKLSPFYERTPVYKSESVTLTVLKDTLVRLRIVGRWATAILTQTLQLANLDESHPNESRWWMTCDQEIRDNHNASTEFWNQLSEYPFLTRVPPHLILGLVVRDPRELLPIDRCKIPPTIPEESTHALPLGISPQLSFSSIWDQSIRDEVTFTKKSDAEINSLRAKNLLPGTPINLEGEGSRIPILLIQQPSFSNSDVDAGWDLIIPAGWAMGFWIPLIYRGARAGGYRENQLLSLEFGKTHFPEECPDTAAGKSVETTEAKELLEKYLKYPPDKRPNYVKLGVTTPFSFPWVRLVNEWRSQILKDNTTMDCKEVENPDKDFFVLRNKQVIKLLQQVISSKSEASSLPETICNKIGVTDYYRAIVACNLCISNKGSLTKFAFIFKPKDEDYDIKLENGKVRGGEVEPHHKDVTKKLRKEFKKRKTEKESQLATEVRDKILSPNLLFAAPDQLISSCSKPIIGFVKGGQFSFSTGKFVGKGFVCLSALVEFLSEAKRKNTTPFVFIRATSSFQYRTASLTIL